MSTYSYKLAVLAYKVQTILATYRHILSTVVTVVTTHQWIAEVLFYSVLGHWVHTD